MNDNQAYALNLLEKILATQPSLLSSSGAPTIQDGENAAAFCIGFIQSYSAWLNQQPM